MKWSNFTEKNSLCYGNIMIQVAQFLIVFNGNVIQNTDLISKLSTIQGNSNFSETTMMQESFNFPGEFS